MTTAQTGLATALARGASGEVIALAEMDGATLLASLSDEQKASIAASLTPPSPAPDAKAEDMKPGDDDKDADCKDGKKPAAEDDGANASAFAAANARALAVVNCEHFAANSSLATTLLANDKLSADEIVEALAAAKPATADADEAARKEMKAALASNSNSNVDAGAQPAPSTTNSSASVWAQASKINGI